MDDRPRPAELAQGHCSDGLCAAPTPMQDSAPMRLCGGGHIETPMVIMTLTIIIVAVRRWAVAVDNDRGRSMAEEGGGG